jgi:undecaprenyl-diphosphatase
VPLWEALLLGVVQGLTEFLPVSSDGHLVMVETLLGGGGQSLPFVIAVHVGTLLAIVVFYRRRIGALIRDFFARDPAALAYTAKLAVGTLPAVFVGLFLKDGVEATFAAPWVAGAGLLLTGTFLITTQRTLPRATFAVPTYRQALWIGCAQALAILPGVSRSGSTIALSLFLGIAPLAAAEFSFLLGVVAIVGAAVLDAKEVLASPPEALRTTLAGAAVAAVTGLAAIALFVRLLRDQRFHLFAYYCWLAGAAFLTYLALR